MSEKHKHLIHKTIDWARQRGYDDIEVEVKVPKTNSNGYYSIDLVARTNHKKIAVECGGSKIGKLNELLGLFNEVWVFPYGNTKPYLWDESMIICQNCGHQIQSEGLRT